MESFRHDIGEECEFMRILAIYRHYWPDTTPYARLLRAILERLAADGHEVAVLTAQPAYNDLAHERQPTNEYLGGVRVRRIRLLPERKSWFAFRLLNSLYFLLRAWAACILARRDLLIANTHPPVLMGLALRLIQGTTGTPYILHCQDIHPEGAVLAGALPDGRVARILTRLDRGSCEAAYRIVTLSEDMRATLLSRPLSEATAKRIEIINNFPLDRYEPAVAAVRPVASSRFRVLFAGNMGGFQDLDRLIDAAELLRDRREFEFILMGAGVALARLKERTAGLNLQNVRFEPHQSVEAAFSCMQQADLGVVSLARGVYRIAYPSKTMMYLSAGCPIVGLVEPQSRIADQICREGLGYVPDGDSAASIARMIVSAWEERHRWTPEARSELQRRAEEIFGRTQALEKWSRLVGVAAVSFLGQEPARTPIVEPLKKVA
jgi:glycosyltransferase involved in cell wall biosynthesis